MIINVTYDSSTAAAPAGFQAVVNYAVGLFDATFTNNVTLNLTVGWGEVGGETLPSKVLGESSATFTDDYSFGQIQTAAKGLATAGNPVPQAALPTVDPTSGAGVVLTSSNAKALGLVPATSTAIDGSIGLKSDASVFDFGLSHTPAPGLEDALGVVEHEITEVMGRTSGLDGDDGPNQLFLLDLYRYSSPGTVDLNASAQTYFSVDHGATSLAKFNANPVGDLGDWASGGAGDSFQSFYNVGPAPMSAADMMSMEALGWTTTPQAAVTAEFATFAPGGLAAGKATTIALDFNTAVSSTRTPTLSLANGGTAAYLGGSGTHVLEFSYTPAQAVTSLSALTPTALNLNGGTLHNSAGADASLSLTGLHLDGYGAIQAPGVGAGSVTGAAQAGDAPTGLTAATNTVFLVTGAGTTLTGGSGVSTAAFTGSLAQYVVTASGSGATVTDGLPGRDGVTTLTNMQQAQFSDYTVVFDQHSSQDYKVYELYQAAFDRVPDNAGFRYWAGVADATNASALTLADQFMASAEFAQKYGAHPTAAQYVTELYTDTLGRPPDPAGLSYWVGLATAGRPMDQLLVDFATSTENAQLIGAQTANGYWTTH